MKKERIQELFDEWKDVSDRARQRMEEAYASAKTRENILFRILVQPAFAPSVSWRVFRRTDRHSGNISYFATRLCWRRDLDVRKFESPVERLRHPRPFSPTFEMQDIELDAAFVEATLARLGEISLPVYVSERSIGLDGITYRLTWGDGFLRAEFEWWYQAPEPWRTLGEWVDKVLGELEGRRAAED